MGSSLLSRSHLIDASDSNLTNISTSILPTTAPNQSPSIVPTTTDSLVSTQTPPVTTQNTPTTPAKTITTEPSTTTSIPLTTAKQTTPVPTTSKLTPQPDTQTPTIIPKTSLPSPTPTNASTPQEELISPTTTEPPTTVVPRIQMVDGPTTALSTSNNTPGTTASASPPSNDRSHYGTLALSCLGALMVIAIGIYALFLRSSKRGPSHRSSEHDHGLPLVPIQQTPQEIIQSAYSDHIFMFDLPTPKEDIAMTSPSSIATTNRISAVDEEDYFSSGYSMYASTTSPETEVSIPRWAASMYFPSSSLRSSPSTSLRQTYPHLKKSIGSRSFTEEPDNTRATNDIIRLEHSLVQNGSVLETIRSVRGEQADSFLLDIHQAGDASHSNH